MGASLVYLDRPQTKKVTSFGQYPGGQGQQGYKYACSEMQGWRLNMVSTRVVRSTLSNERISN